MKLIGLGANLPSHFGAPTATLDAALETISAEGVEIAARSRWYSTPAFPPGSGPEFVNGAARIETDLDAQATLDVLHAIEREAGRDRKRRWAPRVCDLDLLAWDYLVTPDAASVRALMAPIDAETPPDAPNRLILPHPRMHERAFVLLPLAEVAAGWIHPLLGRSVAEMLGDLGSEARAGIAPLG